MRRRAAEYLASLPPCTVCSQCQPHPSLAHSDLGVTMLMLELEMRRGNCDRTRAWADSIVPAPCDLLSLQRCEKCKGIEPHPAAAHDNLTVALHIIKREIAAGREVSARMWLANSKRLVELSAPPLTVRTVRRRDRTLYLYRGGI